MMFKPDHGGIGQAIVLVTNAGTYVGFHYIRYFTTIMYQNFEGMAQALFRLLVLYNALKGFLSVPYGERIFFSNKNRILINSGHKTAVEMYKSDKSDNGVILPFFLS